MSVVGVEIRQKVCTSRAIGGHQRVAYKVRMRARVFGVCVVLLVRCRKMYCFAPRVRFKPSSSNIDRWIWEYAWLCLLEISAHSTANIQCKYGNALFCAWSKNTAGNSNYGLRGAGECCLVPITRFERTQLRIERCGAGKCCLVPTITKIERTQL